MTRRYFQAVLAIAAVIVFASIFYACSSSGPSGSGSAGGAGADGSVRTTIVGSSQ